MFLPSKMGIIASDPCLYGGGNQEMVKTSSTVLHFYLLGRVVAAISLGKPITTEFPHCKIPAVRNHH